MKHGRLAVRPDRVGDQPVGCSYAVPQPLQPPSLLWQLIICCSKSDAIWEVGCTVASLLMHG